jgi:hypothetical protein
MKRRVVLALVMGWLWLPTVSAAQELTYTGSLHYATGEYIFTERSHTFYLINGLDLRVGRLNVSASVPLVLQNSEVITLVGGRPIPTGGRGSGSVARRQDRGRIPMQPRDGSGRRGRSTSLYLAEPAQQTAQEATEVLEPGDYEIHLGDPLLSSSFDVFQGMGAIRSLGFSVTAKVPVADLQSGVGTGEWDYAAGAFLGIGVGRTLFFADLSYWWYGDLPDLELKDAFSYSLGVGMPLGRGRWTVLGSFSGSDRIVPTAAPAASIGVGVGFAPGPGRGLNAGLSIGLTESSSELAAYVGWRTGW